MSDDLPAPSKRAVPAVKAKPRKVKPVSKRGRPQFDTSPSAARVWTPTELADEIGYSRDAIYKWEAQGLERAIGGRGFTMAAVIAFVAGRERAAGRAEADPEDVEFHEKLRGMRAKNDIVEDQRDLQRKKLIEAELAVAVFLDVATHVAVHLRGMGARLMQTLAVEEDAEAIARLIDDDVDQALANLAAEAVDPVSDRRHAYLGGAQLEGQG